MDKTVLGVIIGGILTLLGVLVTNFFNRRNLRLQLQDQVDQERVKLKLSKLEELFKFTSDLLITLNNFRNGLLRMQHERDTDPEKFRVLFDANLLAMANINLLVFLYEPEFKATLFSLVGNINDMHLLSVDAVENEERFKETSDKLTLAGNDCGQLLRKIENKAREYLKLKEPNDISSEQT